MFIWMADQTREEFLRTLRVDGVPADVSKVEVGDGYVEDLPPRKVRVMWRWRPTVGMTPAVVVVPEADLREFFAWANTYLMGWRPISGLRRVVSDREISKYLRDIRNGEITWKYRNALLGMIFCELFSNTMARGGHLRGSSWTYADCAGTYSFAMARAMCVDVVNAERVAEQWWRAHKMSHSTWRGRKLGVVWDPWSALLRVSGLPVDVEGGNDDVSDAVVAICNTLRDGEEIDRDGLNMLTEGLPEVEAGFARMNGPREERVHALDLALRSIDKRPMEWTRVELVALGLLASRIAPGSLDHVGLVGRHMDGAHVAIMWYGLFSGIAKGARIVEQHDSLGRRVLRDILAEDTVFSRPNCDISIDELETLTVSNRLLNHIPINASDQLRIEILPCINTVVPWRAMRPGTRVIQESLFDEERRQLEADIRDLNQVVDRLLKRLQRLGGKGY